MKLKLTKFNYVKGFPLAYNGMNITSIPAGINYNASSNGICYQLFTVGGMRNSLLWTYLNVYTNRKKINRICKVIITSNDTSIKNKHNGLDPNEVYYIAKIDNDDHAVEVFNKLKEWFRNNGAVV